VLAFVACALVAALVSAAFGLAALRLGNVVAEAMTNVAKYAHASHATVSVRRVNGSATVTVADDGIGGADPSGGSGLRGLADRVAALDGHLAVESTAGHGTRISAEIPCA